MIPFDDVRIYLSENNIWVLNLSLAFIMYGVALNIKKEQFVEVFKNPKIILIGLVSQFILLPILTYIFCLVMNPRASIAMGLILVAASPGGNISNFFTSKSKGNIALSVTLTAISTSCAVFLMPLNFTLWSRLLPTTKNLITNFNIDTVEIYLSILKLLGIPLVLGMTTTYFFPSIQKIISKKISLISILILIGFIIVAFSNNFETFTTYFYLFAFYVIAHNLIALLTGYYFSEICKLSVIDKKTISIETGIQNSGIALIIAFNFFPSLGGMAILIGWWGIWDILSGLVTSKIFSYIKN